MDVNKSNTTFQNPVREKGEDTPGVLVVVVAVLGTLVAVGLLAGGAWACVVCGKLHHTQRKWHRRRKFGVEGFPPQPREMVELGHIPHFPPSARHPPCSVNNTGVSQSLGLCASQPNEQLPNLPTPKSWTPSPPFDCKQNRAPMYNAHYSSYNHRRKRVPKRARNEEIHWNQWEREKSTPNDTGGNSLIYHPGYNTLASDLWSVRPECCGSSSSHTSSSRHQPSKMVHQRAYRNTRDERRHQTRWRESKWYDKEPDNRSKPVKKVHAGMDYHRSNQYGAWGDTLDEDTEPPDACSSYRGSPPPRHPLVRVSSYQEEPRPPGAEALDPYQNLRCHERSEGVHGRRADRSCRHRQNMTPQIPRKTKDKQDIATFQRTHPSPAQSLTATKSRRLWRDSCGCGSDALHIQHTSTLHSGPRWLHRHEAARRQHQQAGPPPHPADYVPRDENEAREREVFRRIARKYGFCETCGHEKALEQHAPACGHDGDVGGCDDWDERCAAATNDPTPSMSWDNLTPDPSPALALADTQAPHAAERAISTQINEERDNENENDANDGLGTIVSVRENTYTQSCQSGGEG